MRFNDNTMAQAYHRQRKRCGMCGERLDGTYEAHHIVRAADGGGNQLDNCVLLCGECHKYGAHGGRFRESISLSMSEFPHFYG